MKRAGYEVKTVRGGGISFRLTGQGQERFTRLRASTLGDGYDLQDVLSAIEGKEKRPGRSERKISLAVDIQAKLAAGKGPGYERWAKVFNIKQMAAALAYIQDNGLTDYEQLATESHRGGRPFSYHFRADQADGAGHENQCRAKGRNGSVCQNPSSL